MLSPQVADMGVYSIGRIHLTGFGITGLVCQIHTFLIQVVGYVHSREKRQNLLLELTALLLNLSKQLSGSNTLFMFLLIGNTLFLVGIVNTLVG